MKPGAQKGHKVSEETREKIRAKMKQVWENQTYRETMSEKLMGRIPWNKNTKGICKPNSGSFNSERSKGNKFREGKTPWNKGIQGIQVGENANNWKGGISRKWSMQIVEKKECEICKITEKRLHIHHIDKNPKNNELNNLKIVCPSCHKLIHTGKIKLEGGSR